jgi:class 3 adenylate cyclase
VDDPDIQDDQPYPLRRHFLRWALPVLGLLMVGTVVLSLIMGRSLVEAVYLELAQHRAEAVARLAARQAPEDWARLAAVAPDQAPPTGAATRALIEVVHHALADTPSEQLKIYDRQGRLIFNTEGTGLGTVERGPAMRDLLEEREPQIVLKDTPDAPLYELYVWLPDDGEAPRLIFEFYEPVSYLDGLILTHVAPQIGVPVVLGLGLIVLLWRGVNRAQADIDRRTQALAGVKDRLARLVSRHAVGAARRALEDGAIASRVIDVTLYHADVRDFTGFAEETRPQEVVAYLNRVVGIQVRVIREHGGDIDKMIGDALLAVFEGADRAARAVACAQAVQRVLATEDGLPRGLGIGLHDGFVISGAIGPEERQDFTVIGDAVNVSARLCDLARTGEVVADTRTLARAGHPHGFAAIEEITVKGRSEPLRLRRWRDTASSDTAPQPRPSTSSME